MCLRWVYHSSLAWTTSRSWRCVIFWIDVFCFQMWQWWEKEMVETSWWSWTVARRVRIHQISPWERVFFWQKTVKLRVSLNTSNLYRTWVVSESVDPFIMHEGSFFIHSLSVCTFNVACPVCCCFCHGLALDLTLYMYSWGRDYFQDHGHWHFVTWKSFWCGSDDEYPSEILRNVEDQEYLPYFIDLLANDEWLDCFGTRFDMGRGHETTS